MTELGDSSQNEGDSDILKLCPCLSLSPSTIQFTRDIISRSSFASLPSWLPALHRLVASVELMVVLVTIEALALVMEVLGMAADMEVMELDMEVVMDLDTVVTDMDKKSMR